MIILHITPPPTTIIKRPNLDAETVANWVIPEDLIATVPITLPTPTTPPSTPLLIPTSYITMPNIHNDNTSIAITRQGCFLLNITQQPIHVPTSALMADTPLVKCPQHARIVMPKPGLLNVSRQACKIQNTPFAATKERSLFVCLRLHLLRFLIYSQLRMIIPSTSVSKFEDTTWLLRLPAFVLRYA